VNQARSTLESGVMKRIHDAGCRRVPLDEAMSMVETFMDTCTDVAAARVTKVDQNSSVFHMLCVRQLVLERMRMELITRNLCPVTLHSLCSLFAMCYCNSVNFPQC
jgi:hypothetical protein